MPLESLRAVSFQAPSNSCACARPQESSTKAATNQLIRTGLRGHHCITFLLFGRLYIFRTAFYSTSTG